MLSSAKRLLSLIVLGFALLGFVSVPLGEKSGLAHVRDLVASTKFKDARAKITDEFKTAQEKLITELNEQGPASDSQSFKRRPFQQTTAAGEGRETLPDDHAHPSVSLQKGRR